MFHNKKRSAGGDNENAAQLSGVPECNASV